MKRSIRVLKIAVVNHQVQISKQCPGVAGSQAFERGIHCVMEVTTAAIHQETTRAPASQRNARRTFDPGEPRTVKTRA